MKVKRFRFLIILVGIAVFLNSNIFSISLARNNSSTMTVSPMSQKIMLSPGESKHASIKVSVQNGVENDLTYSLSVGSFNVQKTKNSRDDYGNVDILNRTYYNQMADWIVFDKATGVVSPNSIEEVGFTINVPLDAPAGGQYATILIRDISESSEDLESGISIKSVVQVASVIYAEVSGETKETGEILENNIPSFLFSGELSASSTVKNTGNIDTGAGYVLQVWPLLSDEEICTNEENANIELVMPETQKYHIEKCSLPSVGIFRVKQTVWIFDNQSEVEKILFVCPLWLIFITIIVLIFFVYYLYRKLKFRKTRKKC